MSPTEVPSSSAKYAGCKLLAIDPRLLSVLLVIAISFIGGCSGNGSQGSSALPSGVSTLRTAAQTLHQSLPTLTLPAAGPSSVSYQSPTAYTCKTNYYVAISGSDLNNGMSLNAPWHTLAHAAAQSLVPGSCVNVAPGVYRQSVPLNIAHGGSEASPAGYVTWRCRTMPFRFSGGVLRGEGSGCIVQANAVIFSLISINAPYIIFDGFEIDGHNFDAQRGFQVSGPNVHHIWLLNSDVHHSGQNGVSMVWSEWLFAIHDVWHDNSPCSVNFIAPCKETVGSYGSGLSIWEPYSIKGYVPTTADKAFCSTFPVSLCFHIVAEYNVGYHNYNGQSGSTNTDGEGIIFDTWNSAAYTGAGLIMGNIVFDNGGSGIEVVNSATTGAIVIANNTSFNNHWDTHSPFTWSGEIVEDNAYNVTNINNIAYAISGPGILSGNPPFVAQENGGESTWSNNFSFPAIRNRFAAGFSYPTSGAGRNDDGVDPQFVSITAGSISNNFALAPGSSAIGFGQAFSLWPQHAPVDAGACPSTLTNCP